MLHQEFGAIPESLLCLLHPPGGPALSLPGFYQGCLWPYPLLTFSSLMGPGLRVCI